MRKDLTVMRATRSLTSLGMKGAEEGLRERGSKMATRLREKRDAIRRQRARQLAEIRKRVQKLTDKARTAKARRLRHMVCWVVSCADMVATAFWIGAFPHTHHCYYTFKVIFLILCRWIWYSWHNDHYYLLDVCYFANAALIVYLWVLPDSMELFQAVQGFSGVLMLSVPVFRNSFVPHSLDRVTSLQVHLSPVLQLWLLRWYPTRTDWVPSRFSLAPSLRCYLLWASVYAVVMFVVRRKAIERKGYGTLYTLFAETYGVREMLPRSLQGPVGSRLIFMLGHFCLFSVGLIAVYMPFPVHTLCIILSTIWSFKNGATFYMNYFWKVYEKQIHTFEQQMAQAKAAAEAKTAAESEAAAEVAAAADAEAEKENNHHDAKEAEEEEESEDYCDHQDQQDEKRLMAHETLAGSLELSFASDGEGLLAE